MANAFQRILHSARQLQTLAANPTTTPIPHTQTAAPVTPCVDAAIVFPLPSPPQQTLLSLGIDADRAYQASQLFIRHAQDYRSQCIAEHARVIRRLLDISPGHASRLSRVTETLRDIYLRNLEDMKMKCLSSAQQLMASRASTSETRDGGTIPSSRLLLEYYFSIRTVPTSAEKDFLSKRLTMSRKQVDIWFQNRRARGRSGFNEVGEPIYATRKLSDEERAACATFFNAIEEVSSEDVFGEDSGSEPENNSNFPTPSLSEPHDGNIPNPLDNFIPAPRGIEVSASFAHTEFWERHPAIISPNLPVLDTEDLATDLSRLPTNDEGVALSGAYTADLFVYRTSRTAVTQSPSLFKLKSLYSFEITRAPCEFHHPAFAAPTAGTRNSLSKPTSSTLGKRKLVIPAQAVSTIHRDASSAPSVSSTLPSPHRAVLYTQLDVVSRPAATEIVEEPAPKRARISGTRPMQFQAPPRSATPTPPAAAPSSAVSNDPSTPVRRQRKVAPIPRQTPTALALRRGLQRRLSSASITSSDSSSSSLSPITPPMNMATLFGREGSTMPATPNDTTLPELGTVHWAALGLSHNAPISELDLLATVAGSPLGKQDFTRGMFISPTGDGFHVATE